MKNWFYEAEEFHDHRISDLDSDPELYRIDWLNLYESVNNYDEWKFWNSRERNIYPTYKYRINEINKETECNFINWILRPAKCTKNTNIYYTIILHECMNTLNKIAKFKNVIILLYSWCSSAIIMVKIVSKLRKKKVVATQWQNKTRNFTNYQRIQF